MVDHLKLTMKRDVLSWLARPGWQRRPGRRRVLFAGPWVGEFGWELMNWQGWVRALAPHYEEVVVCAREASRALYADCASRFEPHGLRGAADHVVLRGVENPEEAARIGGLITPEMDHLRPRVYVPGSAQRFIRFGRRLETPPVEVLFHARGREQTAFRNWTVEKWMDLRDRLEAEGLRCGCIGLRGATLELPGVPDFRDAPLGETMDLLASVRGAVGPSSGPMHLASLCGAPHVVWTDRGVYRMGKTSRQKYETWWNPLRTPVRVLDEDGFDAPVEGVAAAVRALCGEGR